MSAKILGIDIGSVKVCAAIAQVNTNGEVSIIAISSVESKGIKKGTITNIEQAANSISLAVNDALRIAGTKYDKVIVSISGKGIQNIPCRTVINIPDKEVTLGQIERLMQDLDSRAKINYDYEAIHVLPYNFKLDDQDDIEDPLGMSGNRLEVEAQIIAAHRQSVINIRKAIEKAGLRADNIVLSGYASAIAILNDDEKELGAALIDLGGSTCDLVIYAGNSIRYSEYLGVGSTNITTDLSTILHTPISKAEELKLNFSSYKRNGVATIDLPYIGDESEIKATSIEQAGQVIFSRVNETLMFLAKMLSESEYFNLINAGVILTGGMTKLEGIREISNLTFDHMPVRIARPNDIEGLDERYKDPAFSCAIGLCLYGAGQFTPYEIDSERKMRYKGESGVVAESNSLLFDNEEIEEEKISPNLNLKIDSSTDNSDLLAGLKPKKSKGIFDDAVGVFTKFINYIKNLF